VWETKTSLVADAKHRFTVAVKGDEVLGPRHWVKIPEEWERQHTRATALTILPVVLIVACRSPLWILRARAVARDRSLARPCDPRRYRDLAPVGALREQRPGVGGELRHLDPWTTAMVVFAASGVFAVVFTFGAVALLAATRRPCSASASASRVVAEEAGGTGSCAARGAGGGRISRAGRDRRAHAGGCGCREHSSPVRGIQSGLPSYDVSFFPGLNTVISVLLNACWSTLSMATLASLLLRFCRSKALLVLVLVVGTALVSATP